MIIIIIMVINRIRTHMQAASVEASVFFILNEAIVLHALFVTYENLQTNYFAAL